MGDFCVVLGVAFEVQLSSEAAALVEEVRFEVQAFGLGGPSQQPLEHGLVVGGVASMRAAVIFEGMMAAVVLLLQHPFFWQLEGLLGVPTAEPPTAPRECELFPFSMSAFRACTSELR